MRGDYCDICKGTTDLMVSNAKNKYKDTVYIYRQARCRTCQRNKMRKYYATPSGRIAIRRTIAKSNKKFPERVVARAAVNWAVKSGKLMKPRICSLCGILAARIEAHHRDYNKPLDIEWLCKPCHAAADRKRPH